MARIGLIDVDGHNFPNLALMKLSAYHRSIGDDVEWATINGYDRTYVSKVFTFSREWNIGLSDYGEIVRGGTGYGINHLPEYIDNQCPDYSIYPKFKEAYGFLTRGCPNKCSWCIVPKKEGGIRAYMDIEEFLDGRKSAILMDNNVLAHDHGLTQIEKIIRLGIKVDFNQGLDARLITDDIARLLANVKWIRYLRLACDTKAQMESVGSAVNLLGNYGLKGYRIFCYVLVKDVEDAHERVLFLKRLGVNPFAQPYRDFVNNVMPTKEQSRFARWVNHKAIFKTTPFEKYGKQTNKVINDVDNLLHPYL